MGEDNVDFHIHGLLFVLTAFSGVLVTWGEIILRNANQRMREMTGSSNGTPRKTSGVLGPKTPVASKPLTAHRSKEHGDEDIDCLESNCGTKTGWLMFTVGWILFALMLASQSEQHRIFQPKNFWAIAVYAVCLGQALLTGSIIRSHGSCGHTQSKRGYQQVSTSDMEQGTQAIPMGKLHRSTRIPTTTHASHCGKDGYTYQDKSRMRFHTTLVIIGWLMIGVLVGVMRGAKTLGYGVGGGLAIGLSITSLQPKERRRTIHWGLSEAMFMIGMSFVVFGNCVYT